MMKWSMIILFCLCRLCICAQDKKQVTADSMQLAGALTYFIESESLPTHPQTYSYRFDSIIFKDLRFDTVEIWRHQ